MLIRRGGERDDSLDRKLAFALAAMAGGLNAAAFHEVGFFSANMTGNVSTLSSLLAMGQWAYGLGYFTIVLAFIAGAMVSTLLIGAGLRRGVITIYAHVILAQGVWLALLGIGRVTLDTAVGVPLLILGPAFLMGLQNAIVTHISEARVRTTHVSGTSTDIGIDLVETERHALAASPCSSASAIWTSRDHGAMRSALVSRGWLGASRASRAAKSPVSSDWR
jgi:uncharacterized membrane protein YoaK (UPF0700 family)